MKTRAKGVLLSLALVMHFSVHAQMPEGKLWVLIIGISEYEFIRPLSYADDDAMAFYEFVKENYGEQIDESEFGNVRILLNKHATGASITNAFKWLVTNAKENDRAIVYFSGHGGTEDLTIKKRGYLMGYDCFDKSYCNGGTMPLSYLNDILETLAFKNVRTLFVADACHAGKANEDDMTYLNSVLSGEMGNITKILSAQGQERSWESPKWGGGHGVFTYYLIQGLIGGADNDPADNAVTLREINTFLDDNVPQSTNYQQNPKILGSIRNLKLSDITQGKFVALQNEFGLTNTSTALAARDNDLELAIPDSVMEVYTDLKEAVAAEDMRAGFDYYEELKDITDIQKVLQNALGLLFAGTMDLSQKYINGFLEIDHYKSEIEEEDLHEYLTDLLIILPADDKDLEEVKARQAFFRAEMLHWGYHDDKVKKGELKAFIPTLEKVLERQSESAYLQYQVGILNFHIGQNEEAIAYAKKAIDLAPNWSHPYNAWANVLMSQLKTDEALKLLQNASRLRQGQDEFYLNRIASIYYEQKKYDSALIISTAYIRAALTDLEVNTELMLAFIEKVNKPEGHLEIAKEEYDVVYQMAKDVLYYTDIYTWADRYRFIFEKTHNQAAYQASLEQFGFLEMAGVIEYLFNNLSALDPEEYETDDLSYYFGVLKNLGDLYLLDSTQKQKADFYAMRYRLFKDTFGTGDKGAYDASTAFFEKYPDQLLSINPAVYPEFEPYGIGYDLGDE